jgi:hypothetical protein
VDKVLGPTCRLAGLLAGRVHLTGTTGTLVGGDPWVSMSHKPRSTCRRSGRDEVTSVWSEDMASMKAHRVHGDPKKKILLSVYEGEHQVSRSRSRGLR